MSSATVVVVAAGTIGLRAAVPLLVGSRGLPPRLEASLSLLGPAAVATLLTSMTVGAGHGGLTPAEPAAVVAALAVVRRTGNPLHAFAVGFGVLWLVQGIGG